MNDPIMITERKWALECAELLRKMNLAFRCCAFWVLVSKQTSIIFNEFYLRCGNVLPLPMLASRAAKTYFWHSIAPRWNVSSRAMAASQWTPDLMKYAALLDVRCEDDVIRRVEAVKKYINWHLFMQSDVGLLVERQTDIERVQSWNFRNDREEWKLREVRGSSALSTSNFTTLQRGTAGPRSGARDPLSTIVSKAWYLFCELLPFTLNVVEARW
jgi:hypothetical protein